MFQDEKVMQTKVCRHCNSEFEITDKDLEFYEKVSPIFETPSNSPLSGGELNNPYPDKGRLGGVLDLGNGKLKYLIPSPTLCPDCRQQRRLAFRNERKLYHRKCDLTGKQIISIYSPDKPYKVFEQNTYVSDTWNPLDYGIDFDFNKGFFEQFNNLLLSVPRKSNNLYTDFENSDYCNHCWHIKNSYLCFNVGYAESCMFCKESYFVKNCLDCLFIKDSELCYGLVNCNKCFKTFYSDTCNNCSNMYYSFSCTSCTNIILCSNLTNKNYCIKNIQYTKEEYEKEILNIYKYEEILYKEYLKVRGKSIHKLDNNIDIENCEGDYLKECENCISCFNLFRGENCKYIYDLDNDGKDCYDMNNLAEAEKCYEGEGVAGYNNIFCYATVYGGYNIYCDLCEYCDYCFACIGLSRKKYCILNKQYSREEYEILVPKIIEHMQKTGEWGEFFPSSISPFGYNETVAEEYFSLSKEEAINKGFNWSDYEKQNGYDGEFYEPKSIENYDENKVGKEVAEKNIKELLKGILQCEITKKPYRIISQELEFYIKHHLPIPTRHPDQRHIDRMKLRNSRKLYDRKCDKCGKDIKTTYSPERPEIVYCETCYNKEVY
ncbi:MAG: hypothetical protein PHE25_00775 [Candidatus Gracilibacteria bacterium]|nr:hypothetical protein [Candidatus Gracilibacteria bacterium]MDD5769478.1 hypothetical protein [Candidatus Gracilibacteria bacterium]